MEDGLWAVGLTRSSVCGDELKSVVAGGPNSGALDVEAENDVRGSAEFSENMWRTAIGAGEGVWRAGTTFVGTMGLEDGTEATEESIGFGEGVVLLAAGILLLLSILTARDIDVLATNQKEGRRHTVTSEELLAFHSPQLT